MAPISRIYGGGGVPHSISVFLSRQHVTQLPLGRRTQGEHVSVHRGIFGPKGMLACSTMSSKIKICEKSTLEPPASRFALHGLCALENLGHSDLDRFARMKVQNLISRVCRKNGPNPEERRIYTNPSYPLWPKFFPF